MTMLRQVLLPVIAGLGMFLSLSSWALSSPIGSAPDDTFHLPTIWCSWGEHESCGRAASGSFIVPETVGESCLIQNSARSAACVYLLTDELVVAPHLAYVESDEEKSTDVLTQLAGNAPYHRFLRIFVGPDAIHSAVAMRIVNVVVASVLLAWALMVSRPGARRALALSWLVVSIPVGMFIMSSSNPSAWAVAGVATFWAFLLALINPKAQMRHGRAVAAVGLILSAGVAVGARADALVFLGASTLAVVVLRWKTLRPRRIALVGLGVIAAILAVLAVVTSINDRFVLITQAFTSDTGKEAAAGGVDPTISHLWEMPSFVWAFIGGQAPTFTVPTNYLRGLSWLDVGVPSVVGILTLLAVSSVLAWGLGSYNLRKLLALGLGAGALVGSILIPLEGTNYGSEGLQPRYFLPMLYVLVAVAALRPRISGRPRIALLALILGASVVANAVAQLAFLRRFTNGESVPWMRMGVEPNWWWVGAPVGPTGVWFAGTVGFAVFAIAVALIARGGLHRRDRKAIEQALEGVEADNAQV